MTSSSLNVLLMEDIAGMYFLLLTLLIAMKNIFFHSFLNAKQLLFQYILHIVSTRTMLNTGKSAIEHYKGRCTRTQ